MTFRPCGSAQRWAFMCGGPGVVFPEQARLRLRHAATAGRCSGLHMYDRYSRARVWTRSETLSRADVHACAARTTSGAAGRRRGRRSCLEHWLPRSRWRLLAAYARRHFSTTDPRCSSPTGGRDAGRCRGRRPCGGALIVRHYGTRGALTAPPLPSLLRRVSCHGHAAPAGAASRWVARRRHVTPHHVAPRCRRTCGRRRLRSTPFNRCMHTARRQLSCGTATAAAAASGYPAVVHGRPARPTPTAAVTACTTLSGR